MNLFNPENMPYVDPDKVSSGSIIYKPDFSSSSQGYEEIYVTRLHFKRVINNDFGDYFEEEVNSSDEANWFDIESLDGFYVNPYETFLTKEEAQKYTLKDLVNNVIPDTEEFIVTHNKRLDGYLKLRDKIIGELNV